MGIPACLVPARAYKPSEVEAGKVLLISPKKRKTQLFIISLRHSAGPSYFAVDNTYNTLPPFEGENGDARGEDLCLGLSPSSRLSLQVASRFLRFESFESFQTATLNVSSNRPFRDRLLSDGSSGDDKPVLATNWRSRPVRRSVPNLSGSDVFAR